MVFKLHQALGSPGRPPEALLSHPPTQVSCVINIGWGLRIVYLPSSQVTQMQLVWGIKH